MGRKRAQPELRSDGPPGGPILTVELPASLLPTTPDALVSIERQEPLRKCPEILHGSLQPSMSSMR
jgi:hypothetical protein